jgi:hypothetical protein
MFAVAALAARAAGGPLGQNQRDWLVNKLGRHCREALVLPLCPMVFHEDVTALCEPCFAQPPAKRGELMRNLLLRQCAEISDDRHCPPLRVRHNRPCHHAAEDTDDLPPPWFPPRTVGGGYHAPCINRAKPRGLTCPGLGHQGKAFQAAVLQRHRAPAPASSGPWQLVGQRSIGGPD